MLFIICFGNQHPELSQAPLRKVRGNPEMEAPASTTSLGPVWLLLASETIPHTLQIAATTYHFEFDRPGFCLFETKRPF